MKCLFRRHKFRHYWDQPIVAAFMVRHVRCERCQLHMVIVWASKEAYMRLGKRPRFKW